MKTKVISIISFCVFLVVGLTVFVLFSHMRPLLIGPADWIGRIILAIIFLLGTFLLKKSERWGNYGPISYAFFTAVVATSIDLYLPSQKWLFSALNISIDTPVGIALDKLDSTLIIVLTILVLNKLSGGTLSSLFIQKGEWKKGLTTGMIAFVISAVGSYFYGAVIRSDRSFFYKNYSLDSVDPSFYPGEFF